jgi:SAM-dependent methyltransferase
MISERLILGKENNYELVHQHLARYEFAKAYVMNKHVLDAACGSGYGSNLLKTAGAKEVVGIDIANDAISIAVQTYPRNGLRFTVSDVEDLSNYRNFDTVISFETIEHLQHPEKFLEEVHNSLLPGGLFIVSTPVRLDGHTQEKPDNPFHVQEWTEEEFKLLLQKYFKIVSTQYQFNFRKIKWLPYSRTIKRFLCRFLFPKIFQELDSYKVKSQKPKYKYLKFSPIYTIVLCTK